MDPVVYFNRAFRPEREATISVRSRALNYGLGCFAGIRGYKTDDGQQVNVFRLDRHVRQLLSLQQLEPGRTDDTHAPYASLRSDVPGCPERG